MRHSQQLLNGDSASLVLMERILMGAGYYLFAALLSSNDWLPCIYRTLYTTVPLSYYRPTESSTPAYQTVFVFVCPTSPHCTSHIVIKRGTRQLRPRVFVQLRIERSQWGKGFFFLCFLFVWSIQARTTVGCEGLWPENLSGRLFRD